MKEVNIIDLIVNKKIIKKGDILYTPIFGNVIFDKFVYSGIDKIGIIYTMLEDKSSYADFTETGHFVIGDHTSPEIMLFPSSDIRDWETFMNDSVSINKHFGVTVNRIGKVEQIFALKEPIKDHNLVDCYFGVSLHTENNNDWYFDDGLWDIDRYATKDEVDMFFEMLISHNVYWDEEKNTIKKLKFKIGDHIYNVLDNNKKIVTVKNITKYGYHTDNGMLILFSNQFEWMTFIPDIKIVDYPKTFWFRTNNNEDIQKALMDKLLLCSGAVLHVDELEKDIYINVDGHIKSFYNDDPIAISAKMFGKELVVDSMNNAVIGL